MTQIKFYRPADEYGCFSNFSRHPVILDSKLWPTTEHYFQAQKFLDNENRTDILNAKSPAEAAAMGRDRSRPLRPDWEEVKDEIMYRALQAKFTQYESLRNILLSTMDADLVEHTSKDSYWGDGGDGSGKNMLGKLLMRLREELKSV